MQDLSDGSEEEDGSDSSDDSDSDLDEAASLASSVAELSSGTLCKLLVCNCSAYTFVTARSCNYR